MQRLSNQICVSLMTLVVITTAVDATDNTDVEKPCRLFDHCWQPGEQVYALPENLLSNSLLTVEELRRLAKPHSIPNSSVSTPSEQSEHAPDSTIQLASFEEDDVTKKSETVENEADESPTNVPASDSITGNGVNVFAKLKLSDLQQEIKIQRESITGDTQVADAVRASRLQILSSANEAIIKLNEFVGASKTYKNQIQNIKEDEEQFGAALNEIGEPATPEVTDSSVSETLIRELNKFQEELSSRKKELSDLEKQIQIRSERVTKIPGERSRANQDLEKINEEIAERLALADDPDNQLTLMLLELKRRASKAELEKLSNEENRQEMGAKVDPLHRDLVSRQVNKLQQEVSNWELAVKELRENEVREAQLAAREKAENAHWLLSPLASRNEELVSDRKTVVESLQELGVELEKISAETESIVQRRTEIENKIEAAGLTGTNGMELVDLRRNLKTTGESHIRIRQLQAELRRVNLTKVDLKEERHELSDLATAVKNRIHIGEKHLLFENAIQFVVTKRDYLDQLVDDYQSLGRRISEVSESRKKLVDEINQTIAYIDENALWIRSAEPIRISDLRSAKSDLETFFDSDQWAEIIARTQQRATQRPYESSAATLFLVVLIAINRRVKRKLVPAEVSHEPSA